MAENKSDGTPSQLSAADEKELRLAEIKAGITKVVYGTSIVGVAAAFFPFVQAFSTEWMAHVFREKQSSRDFLELLGKEGRSPDLEDRITLAEYYSHLTPRIADRKRWGEFLQAQRKARSKLLELRHKIALLEEIRKRRKLTNEELEDFIKDNITLLQLERSAKAFSLLSPLNETNEIFALIDQLDSSDTRERRSARDELAKLGPAIVAPSAARLNCERCYTLQLGISVALARMLRGYLDRRGDISALIDPQSLEKLLDLAGSDDSTMRDNASEFLSNLGDPRIFDSLEKIFGRAGDDGKFDLAVVARGAAPFVSDNRVQNVRTQLNRLRSGLDPNDSPKTIGLLDEALNLLADN